MSQSVKMQAIITYLLKGYLQVCKQNYFKSAA